MRIPKILKDSIFVTGGQSLTYVVGGIWGVLLARWIGIEKYGVYSYWISFATILFSFGEFGFSYFLTRELSANTNKKLFLYIIRIQSIVYGTLLLFLGLLIYISEELSEHLILAFCIAIMVVSNFVSVSLSSWFYARKLATFVSMVDVVKSIVVLISGVCAYYLEADVLWLILIPTFMSVMRSLVLVLRIIFDLLAADESINEPAAQKVDFYRLISKVSPYGFFIWLAAIYQHSDLLILRHFSFTDSDLGILSASLRLSSIVSLLGTAITPVILPKLVADFTESTFKFTQSFIKIFKVIFFLSIFCVIFLVSFGKEIVILLYGSEFQDAGRLFQIYAFGLITPLSVFIGNSIMAINRQDYTLKVSAIVYILIPILKVLFIPIYGLEFIVWLGAILPWLGVPIYGFILFKNLNPPLSYKFIGQLALITILSIILLSLCQSFEVEPFAAFLGIGFLLATLSVRLWGMPRLLKTG